MIALPARAIALATLLVGGQLEPAAAQPSSAAPAGAAETSHGLRVRCEVGELAGFWLAHLHLDNVGREPASFEYTVVVRAGDRVWRSPPITGRLTRGEAMSRSFRPFPANVVIDACEVTGTPDPRTTFVPPRAPPVPALSGELASRRAEIRLTVVSLNVLGFVPVGGRAALDARFGLGAHAELFAGVTAGAHLTPGNVDNVGGIGNPRLGVRAFYPLGRSPRGAVVSGALPVWINPHTDRPLGSYSEGNFTLLDPRDFSQARLLFAPRLDLAWRADSWFIQAGVSQAVARGNGARARDATTLTAGFGVGGDTTMAVEYRLQTWPDGRRLQSLAFAFGGREPRASAWRLLVQPLLTARVPVLGVGFDVARRW
jgi:hypothetical protein